MAPSCNDHVPPSQSGSLKLPQRPPPNTPNSDASANLLVSPKCSLAPQALGITMVVNHDSNDEIPTYLEKD